MERTGIERAAAVVRRVAPVAALVVLVAAVLLGNAAGARAVSRAAPDLRRTEATTIGSAPLRAPDENALVPQVPVQAVWLAPDGTSRLGPLGVAPGTPAGRTVPIWVDTAGRPVLPPVTGTAEAVLVGALTALLGGAVIAASLGLTALAAARQRSRRLAVEWAATEPLWSGRAVADITDGAGGPGEGKRRRGRREP
ncbi:hypothetical protein LWC33_29990 [Pseudonocardia sp. RS11V-5]|uniref:hypothetical protein n=1 Tax=Pseudonocardia terrae TaxID=2905831 RepID=UPI001E2D41E8|nr:hypothetical protein [Pseudonocardia terrae]MCE3555664.1 hypothetical protein [Pseudonocardia terrae]